MHRKIKKIGNYLFFAIIMLFYFKGILLLTIAMLVFTMLGLNIAIYLKRIWLHLTLSMLSVLFPKPIFVYYNPMILKKTKNIIISNHLTEFDWIILLTTLRSFDRFDNICIVLKDSLQKIPLLGYGMKFFGYIFLNRKISKDRQIIIDGAERLKKQDGYDLLIFPEGTYLDKESDKVSKQYILKNPCFLGNEKFEPTEVLLPRTTGFNLIKNSLQNSAQGIIDITILLNPYHKFPQDHFTYDKTITDYTDRLGFIVCLDYIEDFQSNNFVFKRFKEKDDLIKKYKQIRSEEILNEQKFLGLCKKLNFEKPKHRIKKLYVRSEYALFFYMFFFLLLFLYFTLLKINYR